MELPGFEYKKINLTGAQRTQNKWLSNKAEPEQSVSLKIQNCMLYW